MADRDSGEENDSYYDSGEDDEQQVRVVVLIECTGIG